ncbi:MAG: ATP-dependent Clp protease ATP-binding subunit [Chloroflexi bacterium]|nr:MAG: ATP-dependent Clp protease ATP-binding subunit [Chloroflexota bacterium]
MSNKFDRFTKKARQVLTYAQEEAQLMNHGYIGTEHLLLGLVREQTGIPAKILHDLGVDLQKTREIVEEMVGKGKRGQFGRVSLTPRTKRVIELAVDEARRMGHHYIGPEHLLLGLVREGDGIAADVLQTLGINLDKLRSLTLQQMRETPAYAGEKGKGEKKNDTPLVDQLGTDITAQASEGLLDPIIGRKNEIERVIQILSRRRKNNPALIGEPGIGKTAIVEGLAQRIVSGNVPENLLNKRVLMLDVGSLVAGTIYRGQFEERLKRVIDEIKQSKSILFIDEVHMLVGAGAAGSSVDAANILKPALARGELQCIGATTLDEYRKYVESDPALERRFQPVHVEEPTIEETIQILRGVRERYEQHHNLKISDEAILSAANLAARYITDRFMPDKAIDLIDEASARVRLYRGTFAKQDAFAEVPARERDPLDMPSLDDDDLPAAALDDMPQISMGSAWERVGEADPNGKPTVTAEDIAEVVSMWTGVPVTRIAGEESARLMKMESDLHTRVVGQNEAVVQIAKAVRRARAGLKDPKRPIGSFIFLGPTGVGKSEVARALAELLFGSEQALIKLDMSEYQERHTVSRMIGAPPGYIGFDEGGQLTEMVRRRPYSVVLLDEIEKAHPDAFNIMLQVMEDGHLTDGKGRRVDFRNTIIIMTSNVGADLIKRESTLGFKMDKGTQQDDKVRYDKMKDKVLRELKELFRPEFLNRVDSIVVFSALSRDEIKQIVDLELNKLKPRLDEHQITLTIDDGARDLLAEKGYDPVFGARPLKRLIQQMVEDQLSEALLSGKIQHGDTVLAEREGSEVSLRPLAHEAAADGGAEKEQADGPDAPVKETAQSG